MSQWRHVICEICWRAWYGQRVAGVAGAGDEVVPCCFCGQLTVNAIWTRWDPLTTRCRGQTGIHARSYLSRMAARPHAPHPKHYTYPGSVQFAPRPAQPPKGGPAWQEPKDAAGHRLTVVRNYDAKGALKSSTVTAPAGKRFTHTEKAPLPGTRGRPTFVLTMVDDVPAEVVHAELEHVAAVPADEKTEGADAHVIARSTKHEGVEAKGATAEEAVTNLKAKVAAHMKETAAADDDAKKKAADAAAAAEKAKELHDRESKPDENELVTRHG